MKNVLLLVVSLVSLNAFSITDCGYDSSDRKYPHLTWEKATSYKVFTPFINTSALICVGINYDSGKLVRIHYRDAQNHRRSYTLSDVKSRYQPLLKRSDFPAAARLLTRNVIPLEMKITKDVLNANKRTYDIEFKLVRNISIGFSRLDRRKMKIQAHILSGAKGRVEVTVKGRSSNIAFDTIESRISGDLLLKTFVLKRDQRSVGKINIAGLSRI